MGLIYEKKGAIAYFTIDNGPMNVFTPKIHKQFFEAFKEFEIDRDVKIGILSGAGRNFSAGDDIKNNYVPPRTRQQELEAFLFLHQDEGDEPSRPGWERDVAMQRRNKPMIAAIDGYCIGQGMIYTLLHTEIRIATTRAKFGLPELHYGMAGASGSTRLAQHIPYTAAAWMALSGEILPAEEALRVHLINRIVEPDALMSTAEEMAAKITRHPAIAIRVEMEALANGMDLSRFEALRHTQNLYRLQRMGYEGPMDSPVKRNPPKA